MGDENVLRFPVASARAWGGIERVVRETIAAAEGEPGAADFVCSRLRKSFDIVWRETDVTVDAQNLPAAQALTAFFQDRLSALLLQLALAHLEIYRLSHE